MSLQDRIQTLTDLHARLQTLRHVPTMLLRPPSSSPLADFPPPFDPAIDREFAVTFNSTPTHDFRALKDFLDMLCSDKVQEALQAARASEDADRSELGLSFRRETRKRKYATTLGSIDTRLNILADGHNHPSAPHNLTYPLRRVLRHSSRLRRMIHSLYAQSLCSGLCASLTEGTLVNRNRRALPKRTPHFPSVNSRSGHGPRRSETSSRRHGPTGSTVALGRKSLLVP